MCARTQLPFSGGVLWGQIGLEQDTIKMNGQRFSGFTTRARCVTIVRRLLELCSTAGAKESKRDSRGILFVVVARLGFLFPPFCAMPFSPPLFVIRFPSPPCHTISSPTHSHVLLLLFQSLSSILVGVVDFLLFSLSSILSLLALVIPLFSFITPPLPLLPSSPPQLLFRPPSPPPPPPPPPSNAPPICCKTYASPLCSLSILLATSAFI